MSRVALALGIPLLLALAAPLADAAAATNRLPPDQTGRP